MKLLVTGASGLLGTRICQIACLGQHDVYSVYGQHIPTFGTPIKLDITDSNAIDKAFEKVKPDVTVHAAAITDVDKCEQENQRATLHSTNKCHLRLHPSSRKNQFCTMANGKAQKKRRSENSDRPMELADT